jgi:uracil-DNA glycosylase family 4
VPFSGDQSGANLDRFLSSIKLTRKESSSRALRCVIHASSRGANRKPTQRNFTNCSAFCKRTIELVDPRVIVTLGSVALESLKRIQSHELSLKTAASQIHSWNNRVLVPIYHPSPQVLASHREKRSS